MQEIVTEVIWWVGAAVLLLLGIGFIGTALDYTLGYFLRVMGIYGLFLQWQAERLRKRTRDDFHGA